MRRETSSPSVTAGLMWQPETGPTAYAIASSESPNANATPRFPILSPATTAAPTPPKTSTNVPTHSAPARRSGISRPPDHGFRAVFKHPVRCRGSQHPRCREVTNGSAPSDEGLRKARPRQQETTMQPNEISEVLNRPLSQEL